MMRKPKSDTREIMCRNCGNRIKVPAFHGTEFIECKICQWHEAIPPRRKLKASLEHEAGTAFAVLHQRGIQAEEALERIRRLSQVDFEKFIADVFAESVYAVSLPEQSLDAGFALELRKGNELTLLACRRGEAEHLVRREELENLAGAMRHRGAIAGIFLTSGQFAEDAQEYAAVAEIDLMDGEKLLEKMALMDPMVLTNWVEAAPEV